MLSTLDGITVHNGIIISAGIFKGEKWYVPHFYRRATENRYNYREKDSSQELWSICTVTDEERRIFPDLEKVASVGIRMDQGMCVSWVRSCSWRKR